MDWIFIVALPCRENTRKLKASGNVLTNLVGSLDGRLFSNIIWRFSLDPLSPGQPPHCLSGLCHRRELSLDPSFTTIALTLHVWMVLMDPSTLMCTRQASRDMAAGSKSIARNDSSFPGKATPEH